MSAHDRIEDRDRRRRLARAIAAKSPEAHAAVLEAIEASERGAIIPSTLVLTALLLDHGAKAEADIAPDFEVRP